MNYVGWHKQQEALGKLTKTLYTWRMSTGRENVKQETRDKLFQKVRQAAAELAGYPTPSDEW